MYIEPFLVEEWMNAYEGGAKYNIAETCVESMSLRELCALTGEDETEFMRELADLKLTYGDITGYPPLKEGIASLYRGLKGEKNFYYIKPSAGTTALVYYNYDIPSYRFARELYEREGVFVTPGDCFGEPGCFRIGYAGNKNTLIAGLKGLSAYAENLEIEDNVPL